MGSNTNNEDKRGVRYNVFKHKYITNPSVTPADTVIVAAGKVDEILRTYMHPNMTKTTIQALKCLKDTAQEDADANKFTGIKLTPAPHQNT